MLVQKVCRYANFVLALLLRDTCRFRREEAKIDALLSRGHVDAICREDGVDCFDVPTLSLSFVRLILVGCVLAELAAVIGIDGSRCTGRLSAMETSD